MATAKPFFGLLRSYGPLIINILVLVVVSRHLAATANVRDTLDKIVEYGVIEPTPQASITEWTDKRGMVHRITTTRRLSESEQDFDARHAEAVEVFTAAFKPREE